MKKLLRLKTIRTWMISNQKQKGFDVEILQRPGRCSKYTDLVVADSGIKGHFVDQ